MIVALPAGCVSSTAYRASFDSQSEVAGLRECAARCDAASEQGEDVHACLARCPGFSAHPGDRCTLAHEKPGTYCVTVENRVVPDLEFWGFAARVALETAAHSKDEDDSPSGDSPASKTEAASSREHEPARPSVSAPAPRASAVKRR